MNNDGTQGLVYRDIITLVIAPTPTPKPTSIKVKIVSPKNGEIFYISSTPQAQFQNPVIFDFFRQKTEQSGNNILSINSDHPKVHLF